MTEKQREEVIAALVDFVKRVSQPGCATPEEVTVLPAVAKVLFDAQDMPWM